MGVSLLGTRVFNFFFVLSQIPIGRPARSRHESFSPTEETIF